ncbi:hypothetical protein E9232_005462 [Inquilinus ginsengisoli]|uniref:UPF0276 protein E9232_005462 n=1 Tax=Inquilinus ginsengisoli TaxID=363840 RepID=A0ABU1JXB2_9PROT|nr:DUF692 domain-containing protein [Inquilinus ginsengisoli]MDR6292917.1 hypothetical protein [Inquilinus ginsengisoli]
MSASPGANAAAAPIPARAGIGLRHRHVVDFLRQPPAIGWIEIHSENYLSAGGPRLAALERIRQDFPLSCHGVGLSLGSAEGLDRPHLAALRGLFDRFEPGLVSEHVAWSVTGGVFLNDLLPVPFTDEALAVLCRNVDQAQQAFGRQVLIENPSSYLAFAETTMLEWDFLRAIVDRTGCGLLLDVNNIHVSGFNTGFDPDRYLEGVPWDAVQEIHVAGHAVAQFGAEPMLIDDHGSAVADAVWRLLQSALGRTGPLPVLVEWDTAIPELPVLLAEAAKADRLLEAVRAARHAA